MNHIKKSLIFSIGLLIALFNIASPAEAIIGRDDVDAAEYLQSDDAFPAVFDFFDGGGVGTLIAPEWAVTAAHVGRDIPQDGSYVVVIRGCFRAGGQRWASLLNG